MTITTLQADFFNELRNGGHKQGQYRLQRVDEYCPLGVACITAESEAVQLDRFPDGVLRGHSLNSQLAVMGAMGFKDTSGCPESDNAGRLAELVAFVKDRTTHKLAVATHHDCNIILMNDTLDMSFEDVADVLETFADLYFETES